jgi:hypothetical protein
VDETEVLGRAWKKLGLRREAQEGFVIVASALQQALPDVDVVGRFAHWQAVQGPPPGPGVERHGRIELSSETVSVQPGSATVCNAAKTGVSGLRRWSQVRVVAKVEWHQGELYPRVGFIVTDLTRPPAQVVKFYNGRGTAEQWIREGKNALRWTRLSCHSFRHNAVRLQLHALAYNLANFLRSLALPEAVAQWSLTTLREKLVKIGARIVRHGRYVVFQLAEVAVPRALFAEILRRIERLRPRSPPLPSMSIARNDR